MAIVAHKNRFKYENKPLCQLFFSVARINVAHAINDNDEHKNTHRVKMKAYTHNIRCAFLSDAHL